ncbi:helix-turn-helix domain-containing protein [Streptomyces narbonensis]
MPGWKALSDELDPDVRAFAERLRRLVDRSGLGVTAVAERTGHDRSTWDAYLGGRRPVPRSAVAALAEVTGTEPGHLAAEWERAERAWARIGDREGAPDPDGSRDDRTMQIRRLEPARDSAQAPSRDSAQAPSRASAPAATADPPAAPSPSRPRRTLLLYVTATLGALLVVTAALLLVDLGGTGDGADDRAATPPSPTAPTAAPSTALPAGVKCAGPACTGRDPEAMGCGGPLATTVATYLDDGFRDAVIEQLYVHEERFAAPSLGFDASRVLAHALRARRVELAWAAGILALWIIAFPLTQLRQSSSGP